MTTIAAPLSAHPPGNADGKPKSRIQPWLLGPVLFFVCLAGFQVVLVVLITGHDIHQVEEDAYTRTLSFDAEQAARQRFRDLELNLRTITAAGQAVELQIDGSSSALRDLVATGPAELQFYRPDNADLDQRVQWVDPAQPLALALPRSGAWTVTLTAGRGEQAVQATSSIFVP